MSSGISVTLENLIECLEHSRLASSIAVASAALIFYDWLLTYDDEVVELFLAPRQDHIWPRSIRSGPIPWTCMCHCWFASADNHDKQRYDVSDGRNYPVFRTYPCDENVGHMGKKPSNTCISGRFDNRMCNTSDRGSRA